MVQAASQSANDAIASQAAMEAINERSQLAAAEINMRAQNVAASASLAQSMNEALNSQIKKGGEAVSKLSS